MKKEKSSLKTWNSISVLKINPSFLIHLFDIINISSIYQDKLPWNHIRCGGCTQLESIGGSISQISLLMQRRIFPPRYRSITALRGRAVKNGRMIWKNLNVSVFNDKNMNIIQNQCYQKKA